MARLVFTGKVKLGGRQPLALIAGPCVIGDHVSIGRGAVINSAVIGPGVTIRENQFLREQELVAPAL